MRRAGQLAVGLASLLLASPAGAGGLGRPNVISARAFGQGGAFTAVADDPSALHFNPAGLAFQPRDGFLVGGELVVNPRRYTPVTDAGGRGEDQRPHNTLNVLPTLGYTTRLPSKGVPSRLALGVGFWNTFGGSLSYDHLDDTTPALDRTQTAILELVPGLAYQVNERLAIGLAFRLGIGLFNIEATKHPADAEFSATGVGAGFTVGLMFRPPIAGDRLTLGLAYRSPITTKTSGEGTLELISGTPQNVTIEHDQEWPQQASVGLALKVTEKLRVSTQLDWTDWSRMNRIVIELRGLEPQIFELDFHDNFAAHLGGELRASDKLELRAGYTFDSNAVPDRTIERQYLDGDKHGVAVGGGYQLSDRWRVDTAFEYVFGPVRLVEDNRAEYDAAGWSTRRNVAPGEHEGQVYTLELQAQYRY